MEKKNSTHLTPERKNKIRLRLQDGYTVDDIKKAIKGCKGSPSNMGDNENGRLHNDIELICRTGTKLEGFIEMYERSQQGDSTNGHLRQNQKPWESAAAAREREQQQTDERIAELRRRGNGDAQIDIAGVTLSLDDD
jgi:DNA-binding transcriptional MerR regulator